MIGKTNLCPLMYFCQNTVCSQDFSPYLRTEVLTTNLDLSPLSPNFPFNLLGVEVHLLSVLDFQLGVLFANQYLT